MKYILLIIGAGIVLGMTYSPSKRNLLIREFAKIIGKELRKKYPSQYQNSLLRSANNLFAKHLIKTVKTKAGVKITLTNLGKQKTLEYDIDSINLKTKAKNKWDGKWWMVAFDIPQSKGKARDALRMKIKNLGLYPIQKSLFVYPFECRDEIEFIASFFDVLDNIHIFRVDDISINDFLEEKFKTLISIG